MSFVAERPNLQDHWGLGRLELSKGQRQPEPGAEQRKGPKVVNGRWGTTNSRSIANSRQDESRGS